MFFKDLLIIKLIFQQIPFSFFENRHFRELNNNFTFLKVTICKLLDLLSVLIKQISFSANKVHVFFLVSKHTMQNIRSLLKLSDWLNFVDIEIQIFQFTVKSTKVSFQKLIITLARFQVLIQFIAQTCNSQVKRIIFYFLFFAFFSDLISKIFKVSLSIFLESFYFFTSVFCFFYRLFEVLKLTICILFHL